MFNLRITEPEYRKLPAFSYSLLSKFKKKGFAGLDSVFAEETEFTSSLLLGSIVDTLLTEGEEAYNLKYCVGDSSTEVSDTTQKVVSTLHTQYGTTYSSIEEIPEEHLERILNECAYRTSWKLPTRIDKIKKEGQPLYDFYRKTQNKIVVPADVDLKAREMVSSLKAHDVTKHIFNDNPFSTTEQLFQVKCLTTIHNVAYKCMFDNIEINHDQKTIQPRDLKTTSKSAWDFIHNFVDYNYDLQAELYTMILHYVLPEEYRDYTILPFQFIVIDTIEKKPVIWTWDHKCEESDTIYHIHNVLFYNPLYLGEILDVYKNQYLNNTVDTPIDKNRQNNNIIQTLITYGSNQTKQL